MKAITKMITKAALTTANKAAGNASGWMAYQPKEPASVKKMKK